MIDQLLCFSLGSEVDHLRKSVRFWTIAVTQSPRLLLSRSTESSGKAFCSAPEPREQAIVDALVSDLPEAPSLGFSSEAIASAIKRLRLGTSPGLDNWTAEAIRRLPSETFPILGELFRYVETTGNWPPPLLRVKITLLVKPGCSGAHPSHWRPIAVTLMWYRFYGQLRLPALAAQLLPFFPDSILGGIPQRHSGPAVFDLLTRLEKLEPEGLPEFYGIAMDASKCFDRVSWTQVWSMLRGFDVHPSLIRSLAGFYSAHQRFTHMRGLVDTQAWKVTRGLLQGCPMSILCTVLVVSSWHATMPAAVQAQSYIDDRLLLSNTLAALQEAWHESQTWDKEQGWETNIAKTVSFGTRPPPAGGYVPPLPVVQTLKYLGYDVRTVPTAQRPTLLARWEKAKTTGERISQLSAQVSVFLRSQLISAVMTPQWFYGLLTAPPSKELLGFLDIAYRKALWHRKKQMHNWKASLALVYKPWQHSPWGAMIYRQMKAFVKALSYGVQQRWLALWNSPPPVRPSGPIQTTLLFCRQLGFIVLPNFQLQGPDDKVYDLTSAGQPFWRLVQHLLRQVLLRQARHDRPHLKGDSQLDYQQTQRLLKARDNPLLSELVCLVSDGLWTSPRLYHAGHMPHRNCWWCQTPEQTPDHLFWDCPRWASLRPHLDSDTLRMIRSEPASANCGWCFSHFPDGLRNRWPVIQSYMAKVVQGVFQHSAAMRANSSRPSAPPAQGSVQPPLGCDAAPAAPAALAPLGSSLLAKARQLNYTALAGRYAAGHTWSFSQLQWHRLLWFLASVKIVDSPHDAQVPEASVLELYVAYLLANSEARFLSGHPETEGSRLAAHLESFEDALQFFQGAACHDFLVPRQKKGQPKVCWLRKWGLPDSPKLGQGVVIPQWSRVRRYLRSWSDSLPQFEPSAPLHAQPWRRLTLGIPHSQLDPTVGTLPTHPLAWGPAKRLTSKKNVPCWYKEIAVSRKFVVSLDYPPYVDVVHAQTPIKQILSDSGVTSLAQIRHLARAKSLLAQRIRKFEAHTRAAVPQHQHLTNIIEVGHRPICLACGRSGPMTNVFRWLQTPCDSSAGFDTGPLLITLEAHLNDALALHRILMRLCC